MVGVVVLSLAAAACYGAAAVLQHQAASSQPPHLALRADLMWALLRHPRWLFSNLVDFGGYVFQLWALRSGPLTLVEPLLVSSLVFAFPISAWLGHRRVSLHETAAAGVVAGGLAVFLGVARPAVTRPHAPFTGIVVMTAATVLVVGATVVLARRMGHDRHRAGLVMAVGSGVSFGYMAASTALGWVALRHGVVHLLGAWQLYAVLASAVVGAVLAQGAFNSGMLRLSLPTMSTVQPLVAVVIGLAVFGERIVTAGLDPCWEVLGLLATTVGVFALASPQFPEPVTADTATAGP